MTIILTKKRHSIILSDLDVIILAGGIGSRLQPIVKDVPKVLAPISGKPFLDILINLLIKQGFKRFILCVGYLKEQIIHHYLEKKDCDIVISEENTPLGTGGAIYNARDLIKSKTFVVMNGDSLCKLNFLDMLNFHTEKKSILTMALTTIPDINQKDYGIVKIDKLKRIRSFEEKVVSGENNYINAGVYLMQTNIFKYMSTTFNFSIEYDFFPKILKQRCYGFIHAKEMIDIGTPQRLKQATKTLT